MTLPLWLLPILVAATTPVADAPATASPAATSPSGAAPVADASPSAKLEFPQAGYRINAIEDLSKTAKATPWMGSGFSMWPHGYIGSLPSLGAGVVAASDGKRTMAEYVKNEKAGHAHFGDTLLSDHLLSAPEWQVEYVSGADHLGEKEHSYERVLLANGQFYRATATNSESLWTKTGPALKAWVNSLDPITGPGATPTGASPGKLVFPQHGPQHGLRINAPDAALTSDKDEETLMLALGLVVTSQAYAKTLEDYQAATKASQKNAQNKNPEYKFEVMAESFPADNTWVIEFTEELPPDKVNHFIIQTHKYQKTILAHGQLYQAEATMGNYEAADPAYFAKLKACVDSLEAIPVQTTAPAPTQ